MDIESIIATRGLIRHHTATMRGYVSRKVPAGQVREYSGRFGVGVAHVAPRWDTTRFVTVTYYVRPAL